MSDKPMPDNWMPEPTWGDRFAVWVANKAFALFGSKEYIQMYRATFEYGLRSAVRDVREGREAPEDWRVHERHAS